MNVNSVKDRLKNYARKTENKNSQSGLDVIPWLFY